MANWLDELRKKQARAQQLREELAHIEAELRDAKAILAGRLDFDATADKPKSRHGFTGGKRAKPIQRESSVWWALRVLREAGEPLYVDDLIAKMSAESGATFKKSTLISNLSRYIAHEDTFTRPDRSTYGLREFASRTLIDASGPTSDTSRAVNETGGTEPSEH